MEMFYNFFKINSAFVPLKQDNKPYDSLIKILGSSENVP